MELSALIPFVLLLICFVGMKFSLSISSFLALLSSCVLAQFLFSMSTEAWRSASLRTFEISVEIGLILLGAFFFIEVAKKTKTIESLATLIEEVTPNRIAQALLVVFPLELMVEGSSGFGTPLLIITPLLIAIKFDIALCVFLPFITCVVGVPFGALGTPIRLGFPIGSVETFEVVKILLPLVFIAPLWAAFSIQKKLAPKEIAWIVSMSCIFSSLALFVSKSGPEFTALAPAFITFIFGLVSARFLFKINPSKPIREKRGILTYAFLLLCMWIGKQLFMDRLIPSTHIRIFNPGIVFIFIGLMMLVQNRSKETFGILKSTFSTAKRMLWIFFCMAMTVQILRECGALDELNHAIPSFFLQAGSPILAWFGCVLAGTSTVTNLLLAKVASPEAFTGIAAGSAIGVQMAFQSLAAMRSIANDQLTEKEILTKVAPVSAAFVIISTFWYYLIRG